MADAERDTTRTVVKTYVPAYQRAEWDDHADELDMSRSEFVRSMVQAGRRGFEGVPRAPDGSDGAGEAAAASRDPTDLETTVLDALAADEYRSWDELLAAVSDDIEQRLETVLQDLQTAGRVRYSGRHGGYTLAE